MERQSLYERMEATLFAWWAGLGRSSAGARLVHLPGITAACFPAPGERDVFNNAVASRRTPPDRAALTALAALYRDLDVDTWALWVHDDQTATGALAEAAGLVVDTTTLAMTMDLTTGHQEAACEEPSGEIIASPDVDEVRGVLYNAPVLVPMLRACGAPYWALRYDGQTASCVACFDHQGDRGIYMMETAERFRRRGLARLLLRHALRDGRQRGCTSASLQSTAMAEELYASLGFQPLVRYVEWQPRRAVTPGR